MKSSTESSREFLRVGEIVKPHGIEGELVVEPLTDFPEERFRKGNRLYLVCPDESRQELTVESSRWHQERILLKTREVDDRNQAETLRQCWLEIPVDERIEDEETYYGDELVGLEVFTSEGESRGTVADVHPDQVNPLLTIELDDETMVFPLSPGLVESIELDRNRIVLQFPKGWKKLLEATDQES